MQWIPSWLALTYAKLAMRFRGSGFTTKAAVALDESEREATTTINAFEIFYGAHRSARRKEKVTEAQKLFGRLLVIPFDLASSLRATETAAILASEGEG